MLHRVIVSYHENFKSLAFTFLVSDNVQADGDHGHVSTPFMMNQNWPEVVSKFLIHLRELGLVFIRKRKDGQEFLFYKFMLRSSLDTFS